ncbi:hypothetical protein SGL43_03034 [Streptomyces globisporus]|uniref:Uncharacterized protein n=1 Tax=Streptomyces globisporus TaxID=1908 RepID=A0ABN8V0C9_STRGL|nr:hypothetical protein GCM10010264_70940 [Streptomyces globisporus]CAH9416012.1 hypothetical protein SGL43_03034 [Streptomyces globisporus]
MHCHHAADPRGRRRILPGQRRGRDGGVVLLGAGRHHLPGARWDRAVSAVRLGETGKIQAGEAGLRSPRKALEAQRGMEVDLSIIRRGGPFDNPPYIKVL